MIACLLIPGFELRAVLAGREELLYKAFALEPLPGSNNVIGPVTAKAAEAGVRPGMRLGEALSVCPRLCLVEPDPALIEAEWERMLRRLEDVGIAVEPEEPGCLYFETRHVERLYRGLEQVLERALLAVGPFWESRLGAAGRRFAALAAASVARPGQALIVPDAQGQYPEPDERAWQAKFGQAFRSVPGAGHLEPVTAQVPAHDIQQFPVVINDERFFRHNSDYQQSRFHLLIGLTTI